MHSEDQRKNRIDDKSLVQLTESGTSLDEGCPQVVDIIRKNSKRLFSVDDRYSIVDPEGPERWSLSDDLMKLNVDLCHKQPEQLENIHFPTITRHQPNSRETLSERFGWENELGSNGTMSSVGTSNSPHSNACPL